jgi:hypothetical protein
MTSDVVLEVVAPGLVEIVITESAAFGFPSIQLLHLIAAELQTRPCTPAFSVIRKEYHSSRLEGKAKTPAALLIHGTDTLLKLRDCLNINRRICGKSRARPFY